jgi:hypothetical protein
MLPLRRAAPIALAARLAAIVAMLFGLATVISGGRVLLGADPGYVVFRPLLVFNALMGLAYLAVGVLAWRGSAFALRGAGFIALLNLGVLGALLMRWEPDGPIARTSLMAMSFRTAVWAVLFLLLLRARRPGPRGRHAG